MMNKISPKDFADRMRELAKNGDIERMHVDMDDLMCEVLEDCGYKDAVEIFRNTEKWYA